MPSAKKYSLAGCLVILLAVLLVQAHRMSQLVYPPPDPQLQSLIRLTDQARKETEAYRRNGGKPGPDDPALKWAAELWKLRESNPGSPLARNATTTACLLLGEAQQWDALKARMKTLPANDLGWLNAFHQLFWAADFRKDYAGFISLALAVRERAAGDAPEQRTLRARVDYYLGVSYAGQNQHDLARAALQRVVREAPESPWAKKALLQLYDVDYLNLEQPAPAFSATTLDDRTISLADFRGRVVVLDFWATWCGPCLAEIPQMIQLYEKFAARGVAFIGISVDEEQDRAQFVALVAARRIPWPQVFDGKGSDAALAALFNVQGVPAQYVLDRDGKIAARKVGGTVAQLEAELTRLVEKLPSP